jgi:hypothetical protein
MIQEIPSEKQVEQKCSPREKFAAAKSPVGPARAFARQFFNTRLIASKQIIVTAQSVPGLLRALER